MTGYAVTDYAIRCSRDGCVVELDGVVVASTTGDRAFARTLIGQADFRTEVEASLAELRA